MATSDPKRLVPPHPPADLDTIALDSTPARTTTLYRLSSDTHASPLHFSRLGKYRFDSPAARWGVCYLAEDVQTACLEVFADRIRKGRIDFSALHAAVVWRVTVPRELQLLALNGPTLPKIRATVQCFVSRYPLSQAWGRALMAHPGNLDGLIYTGRQSGALCLALFGDNDVARGRPYQPALRSERLGRFTEWQQFPHFLLSTGARVKNLPATLAPTWA